MQHLRKIVQIRNISNQIKKINNINIYKFAQQSVNSQTVDQKEMNHFQNVKDWWDPTGEMRALWEYNILRIDFMNKILKNQLQNESLKNKNVLDVGCGGGLLSESMTRLGANVKGIDACANSIDIAVKHRQLDEHNLKNLQYELTSVENLLKNNNGQQYDIITSMEVFEHVVDKQDFINSISQLLKPNGILFMSTISKTYQSYLKVILGAEYIMGLVQKGTHDWEKFITVEDFQKLSIQNNIIPIQFQGTDYDLLRNKMIYVNSQDLMYLYAGQKQQN